MCSGCPAELAANGSKEPEPEWLVGVYGGEWALAAHRSVNLLAGDSPMRPSTARDLHKTPEQIPEEQSSCCPELLGRP